MNQQLEANRSYVDNLLAQIKEQGAEITRLHYLKTLDDSPLLQALNTAEQEIIILREALDALKTGGRCWCPGTHNIAFYGHTSVCLQTQSIMQKLEEKG